MIKTVPYLLLAGTLFLASCTSDVPSEPDIPPFASYEGWYAYGSDAGGTRYADIDQITPSNVDSLEVAWIVRTGELGQGSPVSEKLTFEATPIFHDETLYFSTAFGEVFALDAATGEERWSFDPEIDRSVNYSEVTSRGVSLWIDSAAEPGAVCRTRIFYGAIDARLIALDAATGRRCDDFGDDGQIDLADGYSLDDNSQYQDYQVTSPPAVIGNRVIVGSSIGDNWQANTGSGAVRAFDTRSGKVDWVWEPLIEDSDDVGAANTWSIISTDPDRDLVFVPTGSPSPDFYGGARIGDNRDANSVVALRASTGEIVWSFQTVHHDLWDYDLAAQPALVDLTEDSLTVPAIIQATKTGNLFVLHRETGEPLIPVEERPVPATDIPGEETSPTQPFSTAPRPLMPQGPFGPDDAWGMNETEREECRALIAGHRNEGIFTPPSLEGTIMFPGNGAGTNWGSVAFDPERQILILNTMRIATLVQLVERDSLEAEEAREEAAGSDFEFGSQRGVPYAMKRRTLLSSSYMPCNAPPWGTLIAVDMESRSVAWEVPLGEWNGEVVGRANGGGSMVTSSGLVFIGATMDNKFRAFDIETGDELWGTELPRSAIATPMSYRTVDGTQYVVIAAGGHGKMGAETGDYVVAFRLKR